MSTLKVANVHFEATGTNRIDYLGDNKIRITSANGTILEGATNDSLLRITQTGTGNALLVEDDTNPDSTPFVVNASGNVGIGTTSAAFKCVISDTTDTRLRVIDTNCTVDVLAASSVGLGYIGTASANSLALMTSLTERARIDTTGNVLIGRTNSTVGQGVKLDVNGAANTSDILVNGTSVSSLGQQTIWVPASAMYPRTTGGAAQGSIQSTTNNINLKTLDFDTATYEFAQFVIQMPKSWNEGTLIFQFIWTHAATTTNFGVVWSVRSTAYANDDALDVAPTGDVGVADTGGTTNDIYITGETPPHTVPGSPAAEELVLFDVYRNYVDVADTMAVDARLIGVKIHYTIDAAKDD